jgi:hypothetical protein
MDDLVRVRSHLPGQISGSIHRAAMLPSRQGRSALEGSTRPSRARPSRVRLTWGPTHPGKLHAQLPVRRAQKKGGGNRPDGTSGSDSDTGIAAAAVLGTQSGTQARLQSGARRFSASMPSLIPVAVSVDQKAHDPAAATKVCLALHCLVSFSIRTKIINSISITLQVSFPVFQAEGRGTTQYA